MNFLIAGPTLLNLLGYLNQGFASVRDLIYDGYGLSGNLGRNRNFP